MNLEIIEQFEEFDDLRDVQLDKMVIQLQLSKLFFKVDVSFSQLVLKQNFELIIKVLRSHRLNLQKLANSFKDFNQLVPTLSSIEEIKEQLQNHSEQLQNHSDRIDQLEIKDNQDLYDKFDQLKKNQDELINKQIQFDKIILELKSKDNAQQEQIDLLNSQFQELTEKQRLLNELKSNDSGTGISPDLIIDIQAQLNKIKSNINDINDKCNKFALKDEFDIIKKDYDEKIQQLKDEISNLTNDLHNNYTHLDQFTDLQSSHEDLQNQLIALRDQYLPQKFNDIDLTTEAINSDLASIKLTIQQLYDILNNFNKDSNVKEIQVPVIQPPPQIDNSKLKNLEGKIQQLQNDIREMNSKINKNEGDIKLNRESAKKNIDELKENKMDKSENQSQQFLDQLNNLRDRINVINNQLQTTDFMAKQNTDDIKQLFEKLSQKKSSIKQIVQQREPQITEDQINSLIKLSFDKLNEDLMKLIDDILNELKLKATKEALQQLEDMMKKIIDEILAQLKTLADKAETKKSFVYLEKKINEIYQLAMQDKTENECDGLLAKKQLGWSCASCDKELDKYKGQLGDFINWAVFPRKETSQINLHLTQQKGPIFALHYANEIAKKAHEAAQYKNFESNNIDNEQPAKPKTSHSNGFHQYSQMSGAYIPQIFKPSNTMYTLKPVNSKIVINTANFFNSNNKDNCNNNSKGIHAVHNQLGFINNLTVKGAKKN